MPDPKPKLPRMPIKPTPVQGLPKIELKDSQLKAIADEAMKSIATKMNMAVTDLPKSIQDEVLAKTKEILDSRAKSLISRDVDTAVKSKILAGTDISALLRARMAAASKGLAVVTQDVSVQNVLKDTAQLLWTKYQYMKTAGFTDDQAFSLLLAEVSGRAGRNRQ